MAYGKLFCGLAGAAASNGVLSLITLGIQSTKNGAYAQAALGYSEMPARHLIYFFAFIFSAAPVWYGMYQTGRARGLQRARKLSEADARAAIERTEAVAGWLMPAFFTVVGVLCVGLSITLRLSLYAETVVDNYRHTAAIIAPYITPEQRVVLDARFAKVKSREDFVALFEEMNATAERNGERRSDFSPW